MKKSIRHMFHRHRRVFERKFKTRMNKKFAERETARQKAAFKRYFG